MIFAIADHIEQIKQGRKRQTRRTSPCADRYQVGKDYSIQPCRTCKGIPEGRILIHGKHRETKIDVTVELDKTMTPEGQTPASEEDIKQEQDRLAAETWWTGKKMSEKATIMNTLLTLGAGAGIMAIASKLLGWW